MIPPSFTLGEKKVDDSPNFGVAEIEEMILSAGW